jgi:hypothetical protein
MAEQRAQPTKDIPSRVDARRPFAKGKSCSSLVAVGTITIAQFPVL